MITKICSACKEERPVGDFSKCKSSKGGYQNNCKVCARRIMAKWYIENKPKRKEYQKTDKFKDIHRSCQRKYRKTENGKIVKKVARSKRCVVIKESDGISLGQWKKILKNQQNRCNICERRFGEDVVPSVDHIIPLLKGGTHSSDNIQAVCCKCNSGKRDKIDVGYIQSWCCATKGG
jgi:hypothetical protein